MSLDKKTKASVIKQFQISGTDTGSPEVQVALLSSKIGRLADHLKQHRKDNHSRRGLLQMLSKRRRLLLFLCGQDESRYKNLIGKVGLSK
ncbi:30S ribosomal protein S15 [candidate division WWE3 bacterium CG08_land_8_20_14_0_20_43_13]|uniref:Small ribosomal subunit protein uS15 n=1 Tax=candidate division WWE3 bacterium CG08_land_8_20_14_0_20_43_13 TaxID=1975087 RepID=A0A2H0X865_UNCKA|nr:MAG: 30S ribosomal protein S15 [candidate division WWE3 bacterium CG08_land_8_20_14_0_20_43_13]